MGSLKVCLPYSCFPSLSLDDLSSYQATFVSGFTALAACSMYKCTLTATCYFSVSFSWKFTVLNNFMIYSGKIRDLEFNVWGNKG